MKSENEHSTESENRSRIERTMTEQAHARLTSAAGRQAEIYGKERGVVVGPRDLQIVLAAINQQRDEWRAIVDRLARLEADVAAARERSEHLSPLAPAELGPGNTSSSRSTGTNTSSNSEGEAG
jgi:hypothetical protein